jgi:outer membrane protein insertion porin family
VKKKICLTAASIVLLFISFAFLISPASGEELKKVALFPFDIYSEKEPAALQKQISEAVLNELLRTKSVRILPRDAFVKDIAGKRIDENLALKTGRAIGADYVIIGSLSQLGKTLSMDSKVIDIRSGQIVQGIFVQGTITEGIGNISARLADKLALKVAGERRIASVVIAGNKKIETNAILNVIKGVKGKLFSPEDLTADIKTIYKMGYFTDVRAIVADSPEGKKITFTVQEKPLVTDLKIKGNEAIDTKDIEAVLTVKTRQFLDVGKIISDVEKIKTLYSNKGYFNAEVKYEIDKKSDKDIRLAYNISEGRRLYIKSISFDGNAAYTGKELKNMMETNEWGIFHFFTDSGVLKEDKLKEDVKKLNAYYLNNGYVNAKINDAEINHDKKWIYVKIQVAEGKRFKVGKIGITGDTITVPRDELLKRLQIRKKDYYDREAIMKDIDTISQAYSDEGYAYADVTPVTVPDEKDQKVNIEFQVVKGDKIYLNRISISGNTKTRDKVVRRQLAIAEGDLYSRAKLKTSYMNLSRLRYFEEVDFQTEKGPEKNLMDINIRVKEKPTGMVSIGAGYSAVEQAILTAQISQGNLFGRGQSIGITGQLGGATRSYQIFFIEPWLFDIPLWSKSELWNYAQTWDSYSLDSKGFGETLGYPLWQNVTGYVGYRLSVDNVKDIQDNASSIVKNQAGVTVTSGVTISLVRETTDDYIFPTRGSKNAGSIEHTGGILLGDVSYTKYTASSAWYFPILWDSVFAVRGKFGYLQGHEDKEVPVYTRFYLGGIGSLRGLRNIGPVDPTTGDVIGGMTMMIYTAEYIFSLIKNAGMKGVFFFDTGNAWESGYHFDDMRKTCGAGIRWYSPIGPLRLEYGYVLDRKDTEAAGRWEFTIGMSM